MIRHLAPKIQSLLHETDQDGNNMLHFAAEGGHADVVRLAVEEYRLDPAARDKVSVYPQVSCKVHCLYSGLCVWMTVHACDKWCRLMRLKWEKFME